MTLRPYQQHQADAALARLRSGKRGTIVMATGTGKTRTASAVVDAFGRPTLWLTDQRALVTQTQPRTSAHVATIQSKPDGRYGLVVVDEAHNFLTDRRIAFIDSLDCPVLALTATPERGDGKSVFDTYGSAVASPYSIGQAIADGYLVDCRMVALDIAGLDLTRVKVTGQDFDTEQLAHEMMQPDVVDACVTAWEEQREGLANFFCVTRAHADLVAAELERRGHKACSIHRGHRDADERLANLGSYDAVTSVLLVTEGFDFPPLQTLVNCRPMRSRRLYIQCLGRALRIHKGKGRALWLDAGGTCEATVDVRHVLEPTDKPARTLTGAPRPREAMLSDVIVEARELGMLAGVQRKGFHRVDFDGRTVEACLTKQGVVVVAHDPRGGISVTLLDPFAVRSVAREIEDESVAWAQAASQPLVGGSKTETARRLRECWRYHQPPSRKQAYVLRAAGVDVPRTHHEAQRAIRRLHARRRA